MLEVVEGPIDPDEVASAVTGPGLGGVVTFTGRVRNQSLGKAVLRLEYEAYRPMAEKALAAIAAEIAERWPGTAIAIRHRVGTLEVGEVAVAIAVAAPHRDAAFAGCRHAIERLKADVPIWKREIFRDGSAWVGVGP